MRIPGWLEPLLRLGLWLSRPKYLVGVFPVCIDGEGRVLLIDKRVGAATGWQLPGGAKDYGLSPEEAACQELRGETGYIALPQDMKLARVEFDEPHRDEHMAYLVLRWSGDIGVLDTVEIKGARWVPLPEAERIIYAPHEAMLDDAVRLWYAHRLIFP